MEDLKADLKKLLQDNKDAIAIKGERKRSFSNPRTWLLSYSRNHWFSNPGVTKRKEEALGDFITELEDTSKYTTHGELYEFIEKIVANSNITAHRNLPSFNRFRLNSTTHSEIESFKTKLEKSNPYIQEHLKTKKLNKKPNERKSTME